MTHFEMTDRRRRRRRRRRPKVVPRAAADFVRQLKIVSRKFSKMYTILELQHELNT